LMKPRSRRDALKALAGLLGAIASGAGLRKTRRGRGERREPVAPRVTPPLRSVKRRG
jgi:hypothetical protein